MRALQLGNNPGIVAEIAVLCWERRSPRWTMDRWLI
jgi:hypothetical protein